MAAITEFLFEDLVVVKNTQWPGTDIDATPVRHHLILELGTVGQDGYVKFEHFGAMSGEDWDLLIGTIGGLVDLNLQAPA